MTLSLELEIAVNNSVMKRIYVPVGNLRSFFHEAMDLSR
jgi:hypothetical protein